jgi:outer membrane protein TolC
MKTYNKILTVIFMLGILNTSFAQQNDSLANYLEIAAKNNPVVLQKWAEYEAALQKVPQVGGLPDPELSLGIFLKPMELVGGNQVADIRLMQMFPWFGVLKNAKDEMSLMAQAKYESFRDAKLQVFYELQQTWYELYKVKAAIQVSEKNLEILKTLERLSMVKFKAASTGAGNTSVAAGAMQSGTTQNATSGSSGMGSMGGNSATTTANSSGGVSATMQNSPMGQQGGSGLADLYRIQMETGELANSIATQQNQLVTITAWFNSYLNRPAQMPVALPDTVVPVALNIPLSGVTDSIIANNPMIEMLRLEEKSLEARKEMVTRMSYPMVGVGLNYSLISKNPMSTSEMNGGDMIMPMMTITLPVYRKKYRAMQTEADLMKTATIQGIQATSNALQNEYYTALQNLQDAERRTELYASQLNLANQSLNILMRSFSASGAGLTDLLRVRQQTLDYELKKIEAVADYNTAISRLQRLMAHSEI